jgi:hypothetical protein
MTEVLRAVLVDLVNLVKASRLPEESERTVLRCLGQLPPLYEKLCLTYESRYGEEITRLERWALKVMAEASSGSAGAALTLANRLGSLHEQLGLPPLDWKPRPVSPRSRKAA